MHCYQNDTDYDYTYWYRQIEGKEPVLIATYIARSPSYETGFGKGFKVWGSETKKWSLTVDVEEDSDAVYLCAASFHSAQILLICGTKTYWKAASAHSWLNPMNVHFSAVLLSVDY